MIKVLIILVVLFSGNISAEDKGSQQKLILHQKGMDEKDFSNDVINYLKKTTTYDIYKNSILCIVNFYNSKSLKSNSINEREMMCVGTYTDGRGNKTCNGRLVNLYNSTAKNPFFVGIGDCSKKMLENSIKQGNLSSVRIKMNVSQKSKYSFYGVLKDEFGVIDSIRQTVGLK